MIEGVIILLFTICAFLGSLILYLSPAVPESWRDYTYGDVEQFLDENKELMEKLND